MVNIEPNISKGGVKCEHKPHLRIMLTENCNLNCIYCRENGESSSGNTEINQHMEKKDFFSVIDCAFQAGFREVKLTGGEPLLNKDIFEIISHASSIMDEVFVVTNGLLLAKYAYQLKKAGVTHIVVHLDTVDHKVYSSITGKDKVNDVIKGIEKCIEFSLPVTVNSVIMNENLSSLNKLTEVSARYKVKLKLIDLMNVDPSSELWQEQFVNFQEIDEILFPLTLRRDIEQPIGNHGTPMYRYKLKNGAIVITRDAAYGGFYHSSCKDCSYYPCQDAMYGVRISSNGKIQKCLIRDDNLIDILENLRGNRLDVVSKKLSEVFHLFAESKFEMGAWKYGSRVQRKEKSHIIVGA